MTTRTDRAMERTVFKPLAVQRRIAAVGLALVSLVTAGCGILDVQTQTQITEDALQLPANASLIVNGAI